MKTLRLALSIITIASVFAGCESDVTQKTEANLSRAEVLQIAEAIAISEKYDIPKYNMTGCHYEFTRNDHSWTVFYELKPPTPAGGHFLVLVDDLTSKATLAHGE